MNKSVFSSVMIALLAVLLTATCVGQGLVEQAWIDRFNGEDNGQIENDYAEAISLDSAGNIYVTGFSFEQMNSNSFSPRYVTIKYSPDGTRQWVRFYRQGTFDSAAFVNGVDSNDNVVVSGEFFNGDDWLTIKYDSDGNQLWTSIYEANSTFVSNPEHMTIDASDNIYLCGYVGSSLNPPFGAVVKISPQGNQLWVAEYYGPEFDGGFAYATAVDASGNVYLAGGAVVTGFSGQAAIAKLSSNGTIQWQNTDGSLFQNASDNFRDIAIDHAGDIVVVGTFGNNTAAGPDVAVSKYDANGDEVWSKVFDAGQSDSGTAVRIDSQNNIIVIGYTEVGFNDYDTVVLKYDAGGNLLWSSTQGGDGLGVDFPYSLSLDTTDNIYFSGVEQPFAGVDYSVAAKYSPDGEFLWKDLYGGPEQCCSSGELIAVDGNDNVYVAGTSYSFQHDNDIATIKLQQAGSNSAVMVADSFTAFRGIFVSGTLENTFASDDAYLKYNPGITLSTTEAPVWLIFDGTLPSEEPGNLSVTLESYSNTVGLSQTMEMFNWTTNSYDVVDVRSATSNSDSIVTVDVTSSISDFIQPGTGSVRSRFGWRQTGLVLLFPWTISIDQVVWTVE